MLFWAGNVIKDDEENDLDTKVRSLSLGCTLS